MPNGHLQIPKANFDFSTVARAGAIRPFLSRNEVTVVQKPVTFRAFESTVIAVGSPQKCTHQLTLIPRNPQTRKET